MLNQPSMDDLDPLDRGRGIAWGSTEMDQPRWVWLYDSPVEGPVYWNPASLQPLSNSVEDWALWVVAPSPPAQPFYQKFARQYRWALHPAIGTVTLLEEWFFNPDFAQWRPARHLDEAPVACPIVPNTLGAQLLALVAPPAPPPPGTAPIAPSGK
jgi:hypothetical protein